MIERVLRITIPLIFTCLFSSSAWAFRPSLVGSFTHATPLYAATEGGAAVANNASSLLGYGVGVLLEAPLGSMTSIEWGGFFLLRRYNDNISTDGGFVRASVTDTTLRIPLVFRLWLNPIFTLGGGVFLSSGFGKLSWSSDSTATRSSYSSLGLLNLDYGVLGLAGFNLPAWENIGLLFEVHYLMGLNDTAVSTLQSRGFREIMILMGIRFGSTGI